MAKSGPISERESVNLQRDGDEKLLEIKSLIGNLPDPTTYDHVEDIDRELLWLQEQIEQLEIIKGRLDMWMGRSRHANSGSRS